MMNSKKQILVNSHHQNLIMMNSISSSSNSSNLDLLSNKSPNIISTLPFKAMINSINQQQNVSSSNDENSSNTSTPSHCYSGMQNPPTTPNLSSNSQNDSISSSILDSPSTTTSNSTSKPPSFLQIQMFQKKHLVTPASSFSPTPASSSSSASVSSVSENLNLSSCSTSRLPNTDGMTPIESRSSLSSADVISITSSLSSKVSCDAMSQVSLSSSTFDTNSTPNCYAFYRFQAFNQAFAAQQQQQQQQQLQLPISSINTPVMPNKNYSNYFGESTFNTTDSTQCKSNDITVIEKTVLENKQNDTVLSNGDNNRNLFTNLFSNQQHQQQQSQQQDAAPKSYGFLRALPKPQETLIKFEMNKDAEKISEESSDDEKARSFNEEGSESDIKNHYDDDMSLKRELTNELNWFTKEEQLQTMRTPNFDVLNKALAKNGSKFRFDTANSNQLFSTPSCVKSAETSKEETTTTKLKPETTTNEANFNQSTMSNYNYAPLSTISSIPRRLFENSREHMNSTFLSTSYIESGPANNYSVIQQPQQSNYETLSTGSSSAPSFLLNNNHSSPRLNYEQLSFKSSFNRQLTINSPLVAQTENESLENSIENRVLSSESEQTDDDDEMVLNEFIDEMLPWTNTANSQQQPEATVLVASKAQSKILGKIEEAVEENDTNEFSEYVTKQGSSRNSTLSAKFKNDPKKLLAKSRPVITMTKTARLRLNKFKQPTTSKFSTTTSTTNSVSSTAPNSFKRFV